MPGVIKINPSVFKDERDALAVAWNEGLRLWMEDNDYEVQSEPTDEQRAKLSDTAYANDEDAMRKTVMARVITRDTSAPNPSAEQKAEAYALLQMIGDTLPEGSGDLEALELLAEDFEADYQQLSGEVPEQPGEEASGEASGEASEQPGQLEEGVPEGAVIPEEEGPEVPEATETDQVSDQATDQVGAGTQAAVEGGEVVDPMEQRARVIRWATDALLKESSRGEDQADGDLDTTTGEKRAVGPYQIWRTYVDSANADLTRQGVTDKKELFSYEDRRDFDKARKIVEIRLGSLYDQGTTDPVHLAGRHRVPAGKNHKLWKTPEQEKYLGELQEILKAKPIAGYSSITPAQKASVAAHAARVKEFEARTGQKWY